MCRERDGWRDEERDEVRNEMDEMIDETHSLVKTRRKDETKERDDGEKAMMTYRGRGGRRRDMAILI